MKTLIDKNTMNYLAFAEVESEIELCDIDCTDGLQRWTDQKYHFFLNGKMPKEKIALPEQKYRTLTNNGNGTYTIIGMSAEDIATIELNEKKEAKRRDFHGFRFRISVKLADVGKNEILNYFYKWCETKKTVHTDGYVIDSVEFIYACMPEILPHHLQFISSLNGLVTVEDIEDEKSWQDETIIMK